MSGRGRESRASPEATACLIEYQCSPVLVQATESIPDSGQSPTRPIRAELLGSPGSSRLRLRRFLALTVQPSLRRFQRGIGLGGFGHSLVR